MSQSSQSASQRPKLIAVSVAACFALHSPLTLANPTGPAVVSGSASFAASGNALTVTNSANAIINWRGFSIGINEITRFVQPSAASAVLNRVTGAGGVIPQSVIDGILSSNGRVFLLNPSGIIVGPSATIDTAGLVMSSMNLSNQDFLNGKLRFTEVPGAGAVVNNGSIQTASGGMVYLIAPSVENNGLIRSPQGEIVLAAGKSVELMTDTSPFVSVRVTADAEQALNVGRLVADSGRIGMYGALVRNAGAVEASGAVLGEGGQIRLVATKDLTLDAGSRVAANGGTGGNVLLQAEGGTNLVAGTVEATGSAGKGGTIQALGVRVGVIGNGVIDASGETGGGSVLVGGDYRGGNPEIQNAERTLIGSGAVVRADARTTGDGGRVIVWADGDTRFYGTISARGGALSGNGGFVETSGKKVLEAFGTVNTGSPNGRGGTWLLDPDEANIVAGADGSASEDWMFPEYSGYAPFGEVGTSAISAGAIAASVASNGFVEIQANQNINFLTGVNTSAAYGDFSALAYGNINLGANTITTQGAVTLIANYGGTGSGSITSTIPSGATQIKTNGGSVDLSGVNVTVGGIDTSGASASLPGAPGNYGGSVFIAGTGNVLVNGSINASGGNGANAVPGQYAYGGYGGGGGLVGISGSSVTVNGSINTRGGNGGNGSTSTDPLYGYAWGGSGGDGGPVFLGASGPIVVGAIDASGGNGGAGGTGTYAWGGDGGHAASFGGEYLAVAQVPSLNGVTIAGSSVTAGTIKARGGDGGAGGIDTSGSGSGSGGWGGDGGQVYVYGSGVVKINDGAIAAPDLVAIDTRGGAGGTGGPAASPAGDGGYGGYGGNILVGGNPDIWLLGSLLSSGGAGGAGGAGNASFPAGSAGLPGGGGSISLDAASGSGKIFVYGGTQFNVSGDPLGVFSYLGTIVIIDPLSLQQVSTAYSQIIEGINKTTDFQGGEDEKKKEDKSNKEFKSCKG